MRAAGDPDQSVCGRHARLDFTRMGKIVRTPGLGREFECARFVFAKKESVHGGREHRAADRRAVDNFSDVDGELTVAVQKLLGTVQRIDKKEAMSDLLHATGSGFFLGDDGDTGSSLCQAGKNES